MDTKENVKKNVKNKKRQKQRNSPNKLKNRVQYHTMYVKYVIFLIIKKEFVLGTILPTTTAILDTICCVCPLCSHTCTHT